MSQMDNYSFQVIIEDVVTCFLEHSVVTGCLWQLQMILLDKKTKKLEKLGKVKDCYNREIIGAKIQVCTF